MTRLQHVSVFLLQVLGGILLAGLVMGILVPLAPGIVGPWLAVLVTLACIGVVALATSRRGGR